MLNFIANWWWLIAAIIVIPAMFAVARRIHLQWGGRMGNWRFIVIALLIIVIAVLVTWYYLESTNLDDWRPKAWQAMQKEELPGKSLIDKATLQDEEWLEEKTNPEKSVKGVINGFFESLKKTRKQGDNPWNRALLDSLQGKKAKKSPSQEPDTTKQETDIFAGIKNETCKKFAQENFFGPYRIKLLISEFVGEQAQTLIDERSLPWFWLVCLSVLIIFFIVGRYPNGMLHTPGERRHTNVDIEL